MMYHVQKLALVLGKWQENQLHEVVKAQHVDNATVPAIVEEKAKRALAFR